MRKYKLLKKKGEGTFSEVLAAQNIKTSDLCAIKCMKQTFTSLDQVNNLREIQALRRLSPHANIVKLHEVLYDKPTGRLALVFELLSFNMYELIRGRRRFLDPGLVKIYSWQMLNAVSHCHKRGIFHRDIKPENVLLSSVVDVHEGLKLADFGSCRGVFSKQPYTEYISTRWYRAPECLLTDGYYGPEMDIWGVACVIFEISALFPLFPGTDEKDQIKRIHSVVGTPSPTLLAKFRAHANSHIDFDFPHERGTGLASLAPHLDPALVDLLTKMLQYDPKQRANAEQALAHPYFDELRAVPPASTPTPGGKSSAAHDTPTAGASTSPSRKGSIGTTDDPSTAGPGSGTKSTTGASTSLTAAQGGGFSSGDKGAKDAGGSGTGAGGLKPSPPAAASTAGGSDGKPGGGGGSMIKKSHASPAAASSASITSKASASLSSPSAASGAAGAHAGASHPPVAPTQPSAAMGAGGKGRVHAATSTLSKGTPTATAAGGSGKAPGGPGASTTTAATVRSKPVSNTTAATATPTAPPSAAAPAPDPSYERRKSWLSLHGGAPPPATSMRAGGGGVEGNATPPRKPSMADGSSASAVYSGVKSGGKGATSGGGGGGGNGPLNLTITSVAGKAAATATTGPVGMISGVAVGSAATHNARNGGGGYDTANAMVHRPSLDGVSTGLMGHAVGKTGGGGMEGRKGAPMLNSHGSKTAWSGSTGTSAAAVAAVARELEAALAEASPRVGVAGGGAKATASHLNHAAYTSSKMPHMRAADVIAGAREAVKDRHHGGGVGWGGAASGAGATPKPTGMYDSAGSSTLRMRLQPMATGVRGYGGETPYRAAGAPGGGGLPPSTSALPPSRLIAPLQQGSYAPAPVGHVGGGVVGRDAVRVEALKSLARGPGGGGPLHGGGDGGGGQGSLLHAMGVLRTGQPSAAINLHGASPMHTSMGVGARDERRVPAFGASLPHPALAAVGGLTTGGGGPVGGPGVVGGGSGLVFGATRSTLPSVRSGVEDVRMLAEVARLSSDVGGVGAYGGAATRRPGASMASGSNGVSQHHWGNGLYSGAGHHHIRASPTTSTTGSAEVAGAALRSGGVTLDPMPTTSTALAPSMRRA